jgi:hypothetical protein
MRTNIEMSRFVLSSATFWIKLVIVTYVLLGSGTVVVLVLDRREKVHGANLVEKGFAELGSSTALGGGSKTLGTSHKGKGNDGRSLHGVCSVIKTDKQKL